MRNRGFVVLLILFFLLSSAVAFAAGSKDTTGATASATKVQWADGAIKRLSYANLTADLPLPITAEKSTLTVATATKNQRQDMNLYRNIRLMNEATNVYPEWTTVDRGQWPKFEPSLFASGEKLPSVVEVWNKDLRWQYAAAGLIIPLDELIFSYAPDIKTVFNIRPDVRKLSTYPNGQLYSIPRMDDTYGLMRGMFVNDKTWMEKLNLKMPTNYEGFLAFVGALVNGDVNGNGTRDEVFYHSAPMTYLAVMKYIFGMQGWSDWNVENGKVQYSWATDKMKDIMTEARRMYELEWIPRQMIDDLAAWNANKSKPVRVISYEWTPENPNVPFIPLFTDPYGKLIHGDQYPTYYDERHWVITKDATDKALAIKWLDYLTCNRDGNLLWAHGQENIDYIWDNGETAPINAASVGEARYKELQDFWAKPENVNYNDFRSGGLQIGYSFHTWRMTTNPVPKAALDNWGSNMWERLVFPTFNNEENALAENWVTPTGGGVSANFAPGEALSTASFVEGSLMRFINGKEPLENWDLFIKQLEKFGLRDYEKAYQMAYDRMQKF